MQTNGFGGIPAQVRATWSGPAPAVGAVVCHSVVKPKHHLNTVLLGVVWKTLSWRDVMR